MENYDDAIFLEYIYIYMYIYICIIESKEYIQFKNNLGICNKKFGTWSRGDQYKVRKTDMTCRKKKIVSVECTEIVHQ